MRRTAALLMPAVAAIALSGCGSGGSGEATACGVPSSATANPSASIPAAGLMLTAPEFPCGGPALTRVSDSRLDGAADSDQRMFANGDDTFRVEDNLLVDASASLAEADYVSFRDAAMQQVTAVSTTESPTGLGSRADEFEGTSSSGHSIITITWVDGRVVVAMLFEDSEDSVDPTFVQQAAQAQNDIILNAGPS